MGTTLFLTQRNKILEAYTQAGQPFQASTKPYKSTVTFSYQNVEVIAAATIAWMVAKSGQAYEWFGYKISDPVPGNSGVPAYRHGNEADTNISKARTTNGAEDFVIEAMSASCRGIRVKSSAFEVASVEASNCLVGNYPIYDPGSLYIAPQIMSPFNLQNGLYRNMAPYISIEFEWDRSRITKVGTLEQLPEGGANSYLNSSGEPSTNDRYRIPEGYIWRREGEPDSEFIVRGTLQDSIACPMLQVSTPGVGTTPLVVNATSVNLDVVLRLHGLSVKLPTRN